MDAKGRVPDEESELADQHRPLPSENYVVRSMPPILGTFDMLSMYILIVFFITNVPFAIAGGVSTLTYWFLVGIVFFVPCVVATAQLGVLFPQEGSLYNWTHHAFGGYWSFFVAFCAWFPGVLVIVTGADTVVTFIQGMNPHWLTEFWQQWLVIVAIIAFSAILSIQRFRTLQYVGNAAVCLIFLAVLIVFLAGLLWLTSGHASVTDFRHLPDWNVGPANLFVFGFVAQAYLGFEVPLNMGGEIQGHGKPRGRNIVIRHLLWGTLIIFLSYMAVTFAQLVTLGARKAANAGNFSLITTVDMALGKFIGSITILCIIAFFILVSAAYNYGFARLLLVAGIDQRLPVKIARLNKHRVPANAIIFQAVLASVFATIFFLVVPYLVHIGNPADLTTQVYAVDQASATLVWTISTAFLFFNLMRLAVRVKAALRKALIVPRWFLWACIVVGPIACLATTIDTLFNSWTGLISESSWFVIVGGLTFLWLVVAAFGSLFANSEAAWETMSKSW